MATSSSTRSPAAHPRGVHPADVNQGIQAALDSGVLAGYPTVDVRATLVDGQYHDVDSVRRWRSRSPARWRSKKAAEMAKPVLLEPIMSVEVVTPEEYMGDVMGDLSSRAAASRAWRPRQHQVVRAQVPLSEMFGYSTDLRSRTQGRATYTMQFDTYQQVPESIATEIIKRVRGE